ncbi:MBL fold metallo-hydrolase [Sporosarcina trichiuri]|uniref:MBL fold metallo-hydrolase n=1 Tax=Sporosarcina trichiuri TaxID=3056445 RepID=UPI0025B53E5F|nr:MBL fold metallo-hydrolase [Sporosarcina sp. 0.2-SM1T-5]WJY28400.1 MBL fold metallo-hydrolase [Sporosarcina sp. 0.2-SM1T-5]
MIHQLTIPTPYAVGDVNAFLVKGDALTLVDAGPRTKEAYGVLENQLGELGVRMTDIEQVLLTHHHPDHSGWTDAFPNAVLLGHEYNNNWLTRDGGFIERHDRFYMDRFVEQGVPEQYLGLVKKMKRAAELMGQRRLDRILTEGDELPGLPGWTALETLGHAQSHLSFWNPGKQVLIGGDLLLSKVSSNPLIEPPLSPDEERPKTLLQYNRSLERLLELPVGIVFSGHGDPVTDVHPLIRQRLEKQHERAMKVHGMLADGPKSVFELTTQLFPKAYQRELGLTLSETLGQMDYLMEQGLIKRNRDDRGIDRYEQS